MSVATQIASLQAAYEANAAAIAGYAAALAADSLDPLESYSLDGESQTRNEWRSGVAAMMKSLTDANEGIVKALNALSPWQVRTRQVLR